LFNSPWLYGWFISTRTFKVCAPTGSGKTNVAMLTILNVMNQFRLKALRVGNSTMRIYERVHCGIVALWHCGNLMKSADFAAVWSKDGSFDLAGFKIVYVAPMKVRVSAGAGGHGCIMMYQLGHLNIAHNHI